MNLSKKLYALLPRHDICREVQNLESYMAVVSSELFTTVGARAGIVK